MIPKRNSKFIKAKNFCSAQIEKKEKTSNIKEGFFCVCANCTSEKDTKIYK